MHIGKNIMKGQITVGIFTDVQIGEKVEWIPKYFGVEIDEWAQWTSDLIINLTSYYKLDKTSGAVIDSLNRHNGTEVNSPTRGIDGIIENAFNFSDTTNSRVDLENISDFKQTTTFSYGGWFNTNSSILQHIFASMADRTVSQAAGTYLELSGGVLGFHIGTVDGASTETILSAGSGLDDGIWHNVIVTYNGTDKTMWVDGLNVGNQSSSPPVYNPITFVGMGFIHVNGDFANQFEGALDEIAYWNKTLSPSSITQLYNNGLGITFAEIFVTLNSPVDNLLSNNDFITFNCSANIIGGGTTLVNMSLYTNESGLWEAKNSTTGLSGKSTTQTFNRTLSEDSHLWNCQMCDSDGDCIFSLQNRTVVIDTISPIINITSPIGQLDYNFIGGNETLNITFTDIDLDICWYDYNGTNITIDGCVTGVKNSTNFILEDNNFNITVYSNDTSGNENSSFIEWNYKVLEINQTFNVNTTEANTETFEANVILGDGLSVAVAVLVYNGTSNVGSVSALGNNTIISVDDVVIPGVDTSVNLSFFWALLLSDSTQINLTSQNQTVFALGIDNCTSFTNKILNFTNVDEELQTLLDNSTMEIAVNIFSSDGDILVLNLSDSFSTNPTTICLNTALTDNSNYLMNVIVKYSAESSAIEYFNIVDFVLNLQTVNQNITLFDLNLSDSTEFQLTFTGVDFLPVESVLVFVERQYISENVFKTVELPQTDANGQTVLHLVRNDIIYNLRFIKDGETLGTFENIIAFCQDFTIGDCIIDLSAISNESAFEPYGEFVGIIYDSPPSFDSSTNLVSFSFVSDDGTTKTVQMSVERRDIFGNKIVCTNAVVSSSGTLFCNIGANLTETVLFTIINVDDSDLVFNTVVIDETSFGDIGYAAWFFLTLILILMASDSKNAVIIVTLISYIGAMSMGWFVGGAIGVGSSGVWVLIISVAALWQINRKRVS